MSPLEEKLTKLAVDTGYWSGADLDYPNFDDAGRVHDWRNHVLTELQILWPRLALEARLVLFITAAEAASEEEWD